MIAGARYPDVIPDVVFWRFTSPIRVKTTGPDPFLNRITSDVLHWDTAKEINQPAGAWNLTLVPGLNDYINILLPGDWCRITADINDGQGERIVGHRVDFGCRRQRRVVEGQAEQPHIVLGDV